jgi:hypothetical protein
MPTPVRGALFGATFLAKTGDIRPTVVGYVWRLPAKVACNYIKMASAPLLAPRQLGFGVTRGAEAAVRAARCYVDSMQQGQLFLKIDFMNAFNIQRRDAIFEAVARYFPELLVFMFSITGHTSNLHMGDYLRQSADGAQQEDPIGSLYFCLAFNALLESALSELVLGYLHEHLYLP